MMLAWCIIATAWGAPAKKTPFIVTNSDGTQLTLILCGDETFHFHTTLDGIPAVQDEQGDWQLKPELADSLQRTWETRSQQRNAHRIRRAKAAAQRRAIKKNAAYTGQKKGIVLLINFPDKHMKSTSTLEKFKQRFNQVGYQEENHYGSVHDYFYDQSYQQFDLTFDVFGPIEVSEKMAHYGQNDAEGNDMLVATLAAETCRLADQKYNINWADYDWDDDGEVDQVYIIYAGCGESSPGVSSSAIWPHEWTLSEGKGWDGDGPITLGGRTIDTYAMSNELASLSSSKLDGIGTACHEFSHCLGLPDFYDTSYSGGFGMSGWDVMDGGCYSGKNYMGECPTGFTAYERWFAGWLEPITLDQPVTITQMPCLHDEPVSYIIYNDGYPDEYFMLENRQPTGWFQYVENYTNMHGILAYHVDYSQLAWDNNTPNISAKHQRMTIIPASGKYGTLVNNGGGKSYYTSEKEFRAQLFPGTQDITELTNTSHTQTGGKLFHKNTDGSYAMNKSVTHITETNGLISFDFMGGDEANGITAPTTLSDAPTQYYNLQGIPVTPTTPGIYLVRQGESVRKVILK